MIDVLDAALHAVAGRSPIALPLLFAGGIATSLGPCAAPRYVAVAAFSNASARPLLPTTLFIAGLIGGYVCLGTAASALQALHIWSTWVYVSLAILLCVGGVMTLFGRHAHDVSVRQRSAAGGGSAFLVGATSVLVMSPCCTPIVAGIAGLTIMSGRAAEGVALLASFALGHAAPLAGAALLGDRVRRIAHRLTASAVSAVIAGTLMLALAAYFATLA
jgi:cytochrome c biogenesis protein CcdA